MKLKVLGTQSPYNTPGHNSPGFLIEEGNHRVMLDCGSGSHSLLNFPNDLINLTVVITHFHRDHYNDIYNLQYATHIFFKQKKISDEIRIFLPVTPDKNLMDIVNEENAFAKYFSIDEAVSVEPPGNLRISFCRVEHPIETYAVKVTNTKTTIVYTSDLGFESKDKIVKFAYGADLLICESSLLNKYGFPEFNSHLTAMQAGIIAKEAKVNKLMLTHFWPEENPKNYLDEAKLVFDNVILASEGALFVV